MPPVDGLLTLTPNQRALLAAFAETGARYLIIGGFALRCHGCQRQTADLDVWLSPSVADAERIASVLADLTVARGLYPASLRREFRNALIEPEKKILWGRRTGPGDDAAREVELFTSMRGINFSFDEADHDAITVELASTTVRVVGLDHLIRLKEASSIDPQRCEAGQRRDAEDLRCLRSIRSST